MIAENLHRAELTKLQHDEQLALWIQLTEQRTADAAGVRPHRKAGQQPGGINAAVREMGIGRSPVTFSHHPKTYLWAMGWRQVSDESANAYFYRLK